VDADVTTFRDSDLDPFTTYAYQVSACNDNGCTGSTQSAEITTLLLAPLVTTTDLADGVVGEAYAGQLEAARGDGTYAWQVSDGALPGGVALAADGGLAGVPTAAGAFEFTVQVTSGELVGSGDLSIAVYEALAVTTAALPAAPRDVPYAAAIEATGGTGDYAWEVGGGSLPDGLTLAADGSVAGTPTSAGTFDFSARVTSGDQTATADLSITVAVVPVVVTASLPNGVVGQAYDRELAAAGGDGAFAWEVAGGMLPDGLALSVEGAITGTPTATGAFDFTVEVTSAGQAATADLTITVFDPLVITTAALDDGLLGVDYQEAVEAAGGDGFFTFALAEGEVPPGIELAADGSLAGTPGEIGTFEFTVQVESGDGQIASAELSIDIAFMKFKAISAGAHHTCALDLAGAAWCWGQGTEGQLGDGADMNRTRPTPVAGGHVFESISGGWFHTCALTSGDDAFCWGAGGRGRLGDGGGESSLVPVAVAGGHKLETIAAGFSHTCAVDRAGAAWCWGTGAGGRLGTGDTADQLEPAAVAGGLDFDDITTGDGFSCAVTTAGKPYCWGENSDGQLGSGDGPNQTAPKAVTTPFILYANVSALSLHTCVLDRSGAPSCWGAGGGGRLGNGDTDGRMTPAAVSGGHAFEVLDVGLEHGCGVNAAGAAWCWGVGYLGRLGTGGVANALVPVAVAGGLTFTAITAGYYHTCALDAESGAWCWGGGGRLGDGSTAGSPVPIRVTGAVAAAAPGWAEPGRSF
jgi:alpha-tubulin suppressor-like RCC1 family protein